MESKTTGSVLVLMFYVLCTDSHETAWKNRRYPNHRFSRYYHHLPLHQLLNVKLI